MDKGKAKMVEDEKEKEEEEVPMDVDGDESKQCNEEIGVQSSNQSALDTMNSLQSSLPTTKGTATSDEANPRKRKPGIPNFFKCGEKSLKTSSGEGRRTEMYKRTVPPMTDASSPKGNTENTDSSATLVQDRAPKPPPGKSRFSHESSSSSPKPPSCASFTSHLFADPSRAVGAGKGNSRLDNSSTREHVSGYTVVKRGRFTMTSWLSCFQPSTASGDNDRNRRPNSSSTNAQSTNTAADGASDRNIRLNNTSPDLSSAVAGDDADRDRRPDSSSSSSNKEGDGAPQK
ncbi:uncharacterized protein LOC113284264 [Papaver somniferum]|uniref:uncharacterized protein LOC113284264 n=1 Tax=Papaver somniferum TaxID=3469 RepID=UPI000E702194|nr:uncharacterized protein LOC113284264 [Papaver somniferum]